MLELLSPAGSPEAIVASVQSGADAIYMGFGEFNARRNAKNFTDDEFEAAVRYCRIRGCKVYVTLNTLVSDRELGEAAALARKASALGADAIIVQDMGLLRVLSQVVPDMPLHASTQMSVHNLEGVEAAAEMGASRVVLARELSLEQIRLIASKSPVEIEVFAHGALCFCYSGQCYMSSLIGRRSGNRGLCAQPCRLQYSMGNRMDNYPMSLKDNCLVNHLKELELAGVKSVKIEGRMKRPEYSAVVTGIYYRAIRDNKQPTEAEMEQLTLAFSRQGFTDAYLTGKKDENMFGIREESDRDANKLFSEARKGYTGVEMRRVPIKFYTMIKKGEPAKIAVEDEKGNKIITTGPIPQPAMTQAITEEAVSEQLYKTGGTPYTCSSVSSVVEPELFLPAAAINEMRRKLLAELTEKRKELPIRNTGVFPVTPTEKKNEGPPLLNFQVLNVDQITPELAELKPAYLYVPLEVLAENFKKTLPFSKEGTNIVAVMPRVVNPDEMHEIRELLLKVKDHGISEVLVGNMGHIKPAALAGFRIRGDFGLNVFNSHAMQILEDANFLSATVSFELRLSQIKDMIKPVDTELIVYGRLPVIVTEQCIIKKGVGRCNCQNPSQLCDRRGAVFPVVREFGCRNVVYNTHKLFLADKREEYQNAGLWAARLMFTTESAFECVQVAKSYLGLKEYKPNGLTRGLYFRGVD